MDISTQRLSAICSVDGPDVIFVVGKDSTEVNASKVHLIASCDYFKQLLEERGVMHQNCLIVRIAEEDPEIMVLVVEFAFLSGKLRQDVQSVMECVNLAAAAKRFEFDELGEYCKRMMLEGILTLDSYWIVFDRYRDLSPYIYQATQEFLYDNSMLCLGDVGFFRISEKSLTTFLENPNVHINSEKVLVKACLDYVRCSGLAENDKREYFRRVALPHLRLYTLKTLTDLDLVKPYLERHEYIRLVTNLAPGGLNRVLEKAMYTELGPVSFNVREIPRKFSVTQEIVFLPKENLPGVEGLLRVPFLVDWKSGCVLVRAETKFELSFRTSKSLTVASVQTLQALRVGHFNAKDARECLKLCSRWRWQLPSSVSIGANTSPELLNGEHELATWRAAVPVEKGSELKVEVCFDQPCLFRQAAMAFNNLQGIPFQFRMYQRENKQAAWEEVINSGVNLFRSISLVQG